MNPLHPEQDQNQKNVYSWTDASKVAARYVEVFDAERAEALRIGYTQQQAADHGQVAAWLDKEARQRRLRVLRCTTDGGRIARHHVLLLEEEDGEVSSLDLGGYVPMSECKRGAHGGTAWLYKAEPINDEWLRVEVMITDMFPDHEMFKRSDGSRIDLGFNDNEHYYSFAVEIHQEDLVDTD
jgi:hypothetical protein